MNPVIGVLVAVVVAVAVLIGFALGKARSRPATPAPPDPSESKTKAEPKPRPKPSSKPKPNPNPTAEELLAEVERESLAQSIIRLKQATARATVARWERRATEAEEEAARLEKLNSSPPTP